MIETPVGISALLGTYTWPLKSMQGEGAEAFGVANARQAEAGRGLELLLEQLRLRTGERRTGAEDDTGERGSSVEPDAAAE